MITNRPDYVHAQLCSLLENAQALLAESAAASMMGQTKTGATTTTTPAVYSCLAMQAEIRTLEFWRSIIAECVASLFYVVIICSVTTSSSEHNVQVNTALASGLAAALLTLSFARVSGAHINPAVTFAMMITRQLSPLRSILYICAQCGGGIAGAALVLGVYARVNDPALQTGGGAFGMEFVLTFMVVYAYCASRAENKTPMNIYQPTNPYATTPQTNYANLPGVKPDSLCIGIAYAACLVAWKGCLNPARALGAAFVSKTPNRFEQHWVFWVGPFLGALTGAFAYEYIFNPRRKPPFNFGSNYNATTGTATTAAMNTVGMVQPTHTIVGTGGIPMRPDEQMSVRSCEDDLEMMDDLERAKHQHYKSNIMQDFNERNSTYSSAALMRSQQGTYGKPYRGQNYPENLYGDTKSMYGGHPMGTNAGMGTYDTKSIYDGYGTKSMYNGYDGGRGMGSSNLRRSRSIHDSAMMSGTSTTPRGIVSRRRNPYDYLPDEPHMTNLNSTTAAAPTSATGTANKPDIMQSVDGRLDSSADTSRNMMNRYGTGKDLDNYNNERLERSSDSAYQTRMTNGPVEEMYDYKQPRRKQLPILPDRTHPYPDQDDYATRSNRTRMGSSTGRPDYYAETNVVDRQPTQSAIGQPAPAASQYSATYSQQNGCSIAPNTGAITY